MASINSRPQEDVEFITIFTRERDGALCSLLRVGEVKIMLECGCNERLDVSQMEVVKREAMKADFILLSHSTCMHVGSLPYLFAQDAVDCKRVIATSPVAKMGA
jgi:Cft2 family RNA processing exonuclease